MNRYLLLFIFLFFLDTSLSAQTPTVSIGTVSSCAGQEVFLNVTASNLFSVVAITLHVDIHSDSLSFVSITNVDPQLQGLVYNYIPNSHSLYVSWYSLVPVNLEQKKIFDIKCVVVEVPALVSFSTDCEIVDNVQGILPVTYLKGRISSSLPEIISQPEAQTISTGGVASFQVFFR